MKAETLSFVIAMAVILGLFFTIQSFKGDEGQAMASSAARSAAAIGDDARLSASQKRSLRRTLLSENGIKSLNGAEVRAVLNQPGLVRRDSPTTIWQYRNASCVLDVYFTTRKSAMAAPVAHYEIRAREKGVTDEDIQEACLQNLVRERAGVSFVSLDGFYKAN